MNSTGDTNRFKSCFDCELHEQIETIVRMILGLDHLVSPYLTTSGFWLGFEIGSEVVGRRRAPFVQLVTRHKGKVGNREMRMFLTIPPKGHHYLDPLRLLDLSGSYSGQAHVTVVKGTGLKPVMALVEQSYRFRRAKLER